MKNFFKGLIRVFKKREEKPKRLREAHPPAVKRGTLLLEEERAKTKAREIILDAKNVAFEIKRKAEEEIKRKEEMLDKRLSSVIKREEKILEKEKNLERKLKEIERIREEEVERLERIARLTREEAKELIFKRIEKDLSQDLAKMIRDAEEKSAGGSREESKRDSGQRDAKSIH